MLGRMGGGCSLCSGGLRRCHASRGGRVGRGRRARAVTDPPGAALLPSAPRHGRCVCLVGAVLGLVPHHPRLLPPPPASPTSSRPMTRSSSPRAPRPRPSPAWRGYPSSRCVAKTSTMVAPLSTTAATAAVAVAVAPRRRRRSLRHRCRCCAKSMSSQRRQPTRCSSAPRGSTPVPGWTWPPRPTWPPPPRRWPTRWPACGGGPPPGGGRGGGLSVRWYVFLGGGKGRGRTAGQAGCHRGAGVTFAGGQGGGRRTWARVSHPVAMGGFGGGGVGWLVGTDQ